MTAIARKVPLHLREQSKKADLVTENMRRLREQRAASEAAGSEPPAPPRVAIVDSRPTIIGDPIPLEQQDLQPEQMQPEVQQPVEMLPQPQLIQEQANANEEVDRLRAELQRTTEMLNRSREGQRADSIRANELSRQLNQQTEQFAQMQSRLRALEQEQETRNAAVVTEADLAARFTPDERKKFGDDYCRSIISAARAEATIAARREAKTHLAPVEARMDTVTRTAQKSRKDVIFGLLDNNPEIRGWRQFDVAQDFQDWLKTTHPLTRKSYKDLLFSGFAIDDTSEAAAACAEVYKAFLSTKPKPVAPRAAPAGTMPVSKPPATGSGLPQRTQANLLTPPQMQALVREMRLTRDPNRKAEIQKTLDAAGRDGLVSR